MKVYASGYGVVSSLGNDPNEYFQALLENRCGVQHIPDYDPVNGLKSSLGAPVVNAPELGLPRSKRRSMSAKSEFAYLATKQALEQAQLPLMGADLKNFNTAICMGSTGASPQSLEAYFKKYIENQGPKGQKANSFLKCMNHSVLANVCSALDYWGPAFSVSSACATSAQALIMGWQLIKSGVYDVVIAGGADELHEIAVAVFDVLHATSTQNENPKMASRPFDANRDGLVVSEGAGVVVLESERSLLKRGGTPLFEFVGGSYLCNGAHLTQNNQEAMMACMNETLKLTETSPESIDYVSAHATSTLQGDTVEARAINEVFANTHVPVSSLKGYLGHSLAACGAMEVIASAKMMETNTLIPNRGLETVDPECGDLNLLKSQKNTTVDAILSNNFAFGGMNASLILKKVK